MSLHDAQSPWKLSDVDVEILKQVMDPNSPVGKFQGTPAVISACLHKGVPLVKSHYSDEMVQRGECPDCHVLLRELD